MSSRAISAFFLLVFPVLIACGSSSERSPERGPDREPASAARPEAGRDTAPASARANASTDRKRSPTAPRIIFLGDSLTAGLGLDVNLSFPALIQQRLDKEGYEYEVVNAGVSGDTSAGGLRRLEWAMSEGNPKVLIVALGGNDGLRGLQPEQLEQNLATIIERAQTRGLTVVLAGMEAPPNFGADYTSRFRNVYPTLARKYKIKLIPFLLDGVAGNPSLNQNDGIHPNPRGAQIIADMVWRILEPELTASSPAK